MYDFKAIEERARKVWKKNEKVIVKAIQDDTKKPLFSFLEGPPTANAPPGIHHLEVRTFKDIICKFKYMNGFSVPRKGGWDCHGLPVEVQVEKKLGLTSKQEVYNYGVDKFITEARESVFSNIQDWADSTKELGYWIDLEKPYVTLDNNYIESVWWSLKELHKKGLLYEGYKVVPFCPRCGTPLSSHEVAQGYKDVKDISVYIAFKVKGKENEYLLAWTTTPWTLPGNVALAVGEDIDYVKVKLSDGDFLILGKEKLELVSGDYEIVEEFKGRDLLGTAYEQLYEVKDLSSDAAHTVIAADFVTTEDGTGIVHTAVMYGEDDYRVGIAAGLPAVHTVGQDGKFLDNVPEFLRGRFVKDPETELDIIKDLKSRHLLFKKQKIEHSYPHCWRCDSPLLYYGITSWFVKVSALRERMTQLNEDISWVPSHIQEGRFGNWLSGAKDWALSRFKFWGTPLPIWRCSCGKEKIIGSVSELRKEANSTLPKEIDLHKPVVDKITLRCDCGKSMQRIPDVIDCWYDSGAASFAQFHYPFESKKEFEKRFPYDFISEAIDQTRGWFYTLHVLGTALFDKPAYKNVICAGHIVDENGNKMSKSKGNIIVPREVLDKVGVDAVRLQFCTSDVGNFKRFSEGLMREMVLPFLTVLYNTHKYYEELPNKKRTLQIEDKWILSRTHSVTQEVTTALDSYEIDKAFIALQQFVVNDLSRFYIRITREREDTKETLAEVLEIVSRLLAPFAPYLSEYVYQSFSKDSVHLGTWPKAEKKKIDEKLEASFDLARSVIERGLSERDKKQIGLKWPLAKADITLQESIEPLTKLRELIQNQLNVKDVSFTPGERLSVILDTTITPELEAEGLVRELSRQVQSFRKNMGLQKKDVISLGVHLSSSTIKKITPFKHLLLERTNAQDALFSSESVTTFEEKFKNKTDLVLKEEKGAIFIAVL